MWCFVGEDFVVHTEDDENSDGSASRISVDHYVSTAIASEQVRFEHLLLLFNRSRQLSPLERWFMPPFVYEYLDQKHEEREAEKLRNSRSQEAPVEEEMDDQTEVGLNTDDFTVSNRALIKDLYEDLRHVRAASGRSAATFDGPDGLSHEGLFADRPTSQRTLTHTPKLALGEAPAPPTSTAANHARPPGAEEGAEARAEAKILDSGLLADWRADHHAVARGRKAADHARPPGPEGARAAKPPADEDRAAQSPAIVLDSGLLADWRAEYQAAAPGRTAANHARPPGQGGGRTAECSGSQPQEVLAWAEALGVHRAGSLREQSREARDGGGLSPRPVLCPCRPLDDSAAHAADAETAADGTRQPSGQGEDISDCTPVTGDTQPTKTI